MAKTRAGTPSRALTPTRVRRAQGRWKRRAQKVKRRYVTSKKTGKRKSGAPLIQRAWAAARRFIRTYRQEISRGRTSRTRRPPGRCNRCREECPGQCRACGVWRDRCPGHSEGSTR